MSEIDEVNLAWMLLSLMMTWTGYLAGRDRGAMSARVESYEERRSRVLSYRFKETDNSGEHK
jgi:hypothetical protein